MIAEPNATHPGRKRCGLAQRPFAYQFLEALQSRIYTTLGQAERFSRRSDPRIQEQIAKEFLEQQRQVMSPGDFNEFRRAVLEGLEAAQKIPLPTRYEDPDRYPLMVNLQEEIEAAAAGLGLPAVDRPFIGTLPTGRVNACAARVPGSSDVLVLFETELFNCALLLAKVVARAMPAHPDGQGGFIFSTAPDDISAEIEREPVILQRFRDFFFAYLCAGAPSRAHPYMLEPPYDYLSYVFFHNLERFVIGHEYAHKLLGHLAGETWLAALPGGEQVEELRRSQEQELAADQLGVKLLFRAALTHGEDLALAICGPVLFFGCEDLIERGRAILTGGTAQPAAPGTHPPANTRRDCLSQWACETLPPAGAALAQQRIHAIDTAVSLLWQAVEAEIEAMHRRGIRPAQSWLLTA